LNYDELFSLEPFALAAAEKQELFQKWLADLSAHHRSNCEAYDRLCTVLGDSLALPVRLFKDFELRSVPRDQVVKTMTSSGTTSQQLSRIYLDKETSSRQSKALSKIVSQFIGKERLPMLIIDSSAVIKDRNMFSARGAGILGFSLLGRDICYALDEDMALDFAALESFCEKNRGRKVLLFGFTSIVWQNFCQELLNCGRSLSLDGSLIHGGGWKKLADQNLDNQAFKSALRQTCGILNVYNYYGMVEQTGSIFMECTAGHLHASVFSDIELLDPLSLKPKAQGVGVLVCKSLLPTSYPGHILMTEDMGEILGEDDCPCGLKGKYFKVIGRMKDAEIRGCSDTFGR